MRNVECGIANKRFFFARFFFSLSGFVSFNKTQHNRKCDICLNKTKHFVNCYRCDKRYCTNCFHSLQSLTCPFCQYDIFEHHINLQNLYTVTM